MTEADRLRYRLEMLEMMTEISEMAPEEADEFVRGVLMLGSCITNRKNHGVFLLVENEDTLKVLGVNTTAHEAGNITSQAAEMFYTTLEAKELHRRGETH